MNDDPKPVIEPGSVIYVWGPVTTAHVWIGPDGKERMAVEVKHPPKPINVGITERP